MNNRLKLTDAFVPLAFLIIAIGAILVAFGPDDIPNQSQPFLLIAGLLALAIASYRGFKVKRPLIDISRKQIVQAFPVVMILVLIGTVSAAWMYSGVVPTLICYGMKTLKPATFLLTTCAVCAFVSVLSGSSWTTIATIGVAFMGIGIMWGFNVAMTAGAIISGAYFGDKISPMSDTTVLASSACGVDLFEHIRNMLVTTIPAMSIALIAYAIIGYVTDYHPVESSNEILASLHKTFNISPWTLLIPLATIVVLICRINTVWTLVISTLLGVGGLFLFQPNVAAHLVAASDGSHVYAIARLLCGETSMDVGNDLLSNLITTGGVAGMWTTIRLVICAMFFGTCMIASGMLNVITGVLTNRLARRQSIVSSTVLTGILLNSFTGDQYLSIILNGSVYRDLYHRNGYPPYILSRTVEDSTSVTSVLIPWNSCGITQSTVLGVSTLSYMPFCFFNIASPIITIIVAWIVSWRSSFKNAANVAV